MTKKEKEAIRLLSGLMFKGKLKEALDMAIKALVQEPCDVFDEYGNYKYPGDVELTEPNTATSMPCEDAISRQAVIDAMYALCNTGETLKENPWRDNPHIDAITDAIEDLPLVHSQPNKEDIHREREQAYMRGYEDGSRKYRTAQSEDAISRQAAEKITWEEPSYSDALNVLTEVRDKVRALPPVNPQLKTGHWIISPNDCFATCSECGLHGDKGIYKHYGWCPNCGARMIEPQETETWNGIHAQLTAPKGTFERIFNDADDDNDI